MLGEGLLGRVERESGFVQLREEEDGGGLLGLEDPSPSLFFHQQQHNLPSFFLQPPHLPPPKTHSHPHMDLPPPPETSNDAANTSNNVPQPNIDANSAATGPCEVSKKEEDDVDCAGEKSSSSISTVLMGSVKDRGEAFVERLRSVGGGGGMGLPSSEEFSQFERMFYGQVEEMRLLKEKFSSARLAVLQLEEEKRSLEMKLVGERAEREGERRNAQAELERSKMMSDNAAYAIKSEADTWKRKTEAAQQELKWLKEQLRTLEMEKIDALRRLGEIREKSENAVQYGVAVEAYAARQKDVMSENKRALMELEQARDMLAKIVEGNNMRMRAITAHLKLENKARKAAEAKTEKVEVELISTRAKLVQERGELHRTQTAEARKTDLLKKVVTENSELHNGIEILLNSFEGKLDTDTRNFVKQVKELHNETQSTIRSGLV